MNERNRQPLITGAAIVYENHAVIVGTLVWGRIRQSASTRTRSASPSSTGSSSDWVTPWR
jgi:hypothetical protein